MNYDNIILELLDRIKVLEEQVKILMEKEQKETQVETYPYIVVMMEYIDKDVIYQ